MSINRLELDIVVNKHLEPTKQEHIVWNAFVIIATILAWLTKTLYFIHEMELTPHPIFLLIESVGITLIIGSFWAEKKAIWKSVLAMIIYTLLSVLLYADVVYERYYGALLSIDILNQANQVGTISESIYSLMLPTDFLYFIDLIVLIGFVIFYHRKGINLPLKRLPSVFVMLGITMICVSSFHPLKEIHTDQFKVSVSGVLSTHVFSLWHELIQGERKKSPDEFGSLLKESKIKFAKNQAIQKTSPYYGKFKGKNIIMVQAESINDFVINLKVNGEEVTPNLNKLVNESHYYSNIYTQIGRGNTSDAEFVANNSLHPEAEGGIYKGAPTHNYISLPNVLKDLGYSTSATHGNDPEFWNRQQAYKKQGYEVFYNKNHPLIQDDEILGLGISDESIFRQMAQIYKKEEGPFYNFIISLTSHRPFVMPKEYQKMNLPPEMNDSNTENYLQSVYYFDKAVGMFIDQIKKEGLWDNSIFVLYGDHYGLLPKDKDEIKKFINIDFDQKERLNIPLIIHHPGQTEGVTNDIIGSQMDIYPTLTSLLGIERPLVQLGKPLDAPIEGFVGFGHEAKRFSFYSQNYYYDAAYDQNFENGVCYDSKTGKIVPVDKCKKGFTHIYREYNLSTKLIQNDLIAEVYPVK